MFKIMNIFNYIKHLNVISIHIYIKSYQSIFAFFIIYFLKRTVNENKEKLSAFFPRTSTLKLLQSNRENIFKII